MFVLKERPYSAHVLISFWCDSDDKNYDFFLLFRILADISVFSFWRSSKLVNLAIHPARIISKYLQYAYWP